MKTTLLELFGFALVAYGCWLAWQPLGLIVGGVLLALVGWLADRGGQ